MSLLFFRALYQSKNHVIPHTVIAVILNVILNISKHREQQLQKQPLLRNIRDYWKKVINCDQVEFCFKMAAILDTILNI